MLEVEWAEGPSIPSTTSASFAAAAFFRKCVLLIDGTSPLPGWEEHQAECFEDMQKRGVRTATCAEYVA